MSIDWLKNTELVKIADLGKDVDYTEVAEMIYNIDPCLYKDFFGSEGNAIHYIREALDMDFSIFNKDYLQVLVSDEGKILGTAVVYPKDTLYIEDAEKNFFEWNGMDLSPAFDYVSEYYKNFINNNRGVLKVASINVEKSNRGHGYGNLIMQEINKKTKGQTKYLTVLGGNMRAIKTYLGNGYVFTKEFADYFGLKPEGVELASCYSMVNSDNLSCKPLNLSLSQAIETASPNRVVKTDDYFNNFSRNPKKFVIRGEYNPEIQAKASQYEENGLQN